MVSMVEKLVAVRDKIPKDASDILGLIKAAIDPGGGGDPIWSGWGCLLEILNLTPKRRPIWAWLKLKQTPKRDQFIKQTNKKYS